MSSLANESILMQAIRVKSKDSILNGTISLHTTATESSVETEGDGLKINAKM